jgi:hypothetical protein
MGGTANRVTSDEMVVPIEEQPHRIQPVVADLGEERARCFGVHTVAAIPPVPSALL